MIKKLRIKFICVNMFSVICLLVVVAAAGFGYMRRELIEDRVAMMSRVAEQPPRPYAPVGKGKDEPLLSWFTLERTEGGGVKGYGSDTFDLSDEELLEKILETAEKMPEKTGTLNEFDLRYYRAEKDRTLKVVFSDLASERVTLHRVYRAYALIGTASAAGLFVLNLLLSAWAVRPVDEAWRQQKQFVADASHELKTPLTVIMSNAELLQQPGYSTEERQRFSASIFTMAQQMRSLVESLLELARLDSTRETPEFETIDFSAMTEDCLLPFEPLYYERGLTLESMVEPGIHVRGKEQSLRQVVDILLDNAQKYSQPGSVYLNLNQTGRSCLLTVKNPTPELSRAECRDVFKRFYRRDEARTISGSYGLGLPIAESIVTHHGGKISCEWADGEICFSVTLPLA